MANAVKRTPLATRILIGLCGLIALVVLVTHLFLMNAVEDFSLEHTRNALDGAAKRLLEQPELQDPNTPPQHRDAFLKRHAAILDARITLADANGTVLLDTSTETPEQLDSHSGHPEFKDALDHGHGFIVRHSKTLGREMLYVAHRIRDTQGSPVLRLAQPTVQMEDASSSLRETLYWLASGTLLCALIFSFLIARWLSKPIRAFTEEARAIAQGQLDRKLSPQAVSVAELQDLAEAVSGITRELKRTMKRLRHDSPQLKALLDGLELPVLIINPAGQILRTNNASHHRLGLLYTVPDLDDAGLAELIPHLKHLDGDGNVSPFSVEITHRDDGEAHNTRWSVTVMPITRFESVLGAALIMHPRSADDGSIKPPRPVSPEAATDDP